MSMMAKSQAGMATSVPLIDEFPDAVKIVLRAGAALCYKAANPPEKGA